MHALHTRAVSPPIPRGPGLWSITLQVAAEDEVVLWGLLLGEDGLCSAHGERDRPGRVVLVTPESQRARLEAWVDEISGELPSLRRELDEPRLATPAKLREA
jgi:hypothetical protein